MLARMLFRNGLHCHCQAANMIGSHAISSLRPCSLVSVLCRKDRSLATRRLVAPSLVKSHSSHALITICPLILSVFLAGSLAYAVFSGRIAVETPTARQIKDLNSCPSSWKSYIRECLLDQTKTARECAAVFSDESVESSQPLSFS